MLLTIGESIRRLRTARSLTQEKLAEVLNVTAQTVSRWESGAVYPDLETLPGIAVYFAVSLDELTGMAALRGEEYLRELFATAQALRVKGQLKDAQAGLRRGLKLYPGNLGLMSELALTLSQMGESDEAICLSERVLAGHPSVKLRATTAANLVFLYLSAGEREAAAKLVAGFGHVWESRELMRAQTAPGEYGDALRQSVRDVLAVLCGMIDGVGTHGDGKPDTIFSAGMDCVKPLSDAEMLAQLAEFLGEDA